MKNALTSMFGLEHPIFQAPMGRCSPPEMAAAVSNAGGLGMLGVSWDNFETIESHLAKLANLTDKQVAFNFCLQMDQEDRIQYALDNGVKIISLFWGDPTPFIDRIHKAGAKVISTVGSVDHAKRDLDAGVDVICAQGYEGGGHVYSKTGTLVLTPAVVDEAGSVPVIAAGGISDGRGLAAVMALGASAGWLGTRFLASKESFAHPGYILNVLQTGHDQTLSTEIFDRAWPEAPHRVIQNSTYTLWKETGMGVGDNRAGSEDIIAHRGDKPIYRYDEAGPTADMTGNVEALAQYAGQGVGFINDIKGCAELVREISDEAQTILARLKV